MEDNVGFIRANNAGTAYVLKRYRPDYVMLPNNDTQVIETIGSRALTARYALIAVLKEPMVAEVSHDKRTQSNVNRFYAISSDLSHLNDKGAQVEEKESTLRSARFAWKKSH